MLNSEFVPGGIGAGMLPEGQPPDDQIIEYVKAKRSAHKQVGALFDVTEPNGKPDMIVNACLMHAHDLALLLGHSQYDCIHLVTSLIADLNGRKKLTGALASLDTPVILKPDCVLRACTDHVSCQQKPIAVADRERVEGSDALKAWFAAAKDLLKERSVEAQYIEVKHLVVAARASCVPEIADIWRLLNAEAVPTLEQRIGSIKSDVSNGKTEVKDWVDAAMASVTGAFGKVAERVADHEDRSKERIARLEWILSSMHGAVDKVGERVDEHEQRSTARMDRLEQILSSMHGAVDKVGERVDEHEQRSMARMEHQGDNWSSTHGAIDKVREKVEAVEGAVSAHQHEIKAGFSLIDNGGTPSKKLHSATENVAHIYRDRIGLVWSSISLLAAVLIGGGAGFLLQP